MGGARARGSAAHGPIPDLDLHDGDEPSPAALKEAALAAEDAARAVPGVTNSEGGGASARRAVVWALATSHGFAGAYPDHQPRHPGERAGGQRAERWCATTPIIRRATARTSTRPRRSAARPASARSRGVNPGQPASGPMPVMFDPRVGSSLIGHLIGAIAGAAIARRTSFLLGKLGEQIFADGITIIDDPHRPHGLRSRPFDGEGLPVSPTDLVRDGVLADLAARHRPRRGNWGWSRPAMPCAAESGAPGVGGEQHLYRAGQGQPRRPVRGHRARRLRHRD